MHRNPRFFYLLSLSNTFNKFLHCKTKSLATIFNFFVKRSIITINKIKTTKNIIGKDKDFEPSTSATCIAHRKSFRECAEYGYTYGVRGASCTANCLRKGPFQDCKLRNKCEYIKSIGCFEKSSCTDIGPLDNCRKWETSLICNYIDPFFYFAL